MKKSLILALLAAVFILSACGKPNPTPPTPAKITFATPYPGPDQSVLPPDAYPLPSPYQAPTTVSTMEAVPLKLNTPITEGATSVSGTGPANIPIVVADISLFGQVLGEGKINADGTFNVTLTNPMEKGHRIGVTIGETKGTEWEGQDFTKEGFFGTEPQLVPNVGFFYDTAMSVGN